MTVGIRLVDESLTRNAQAQILIHRKMLEMPDGAHAAYTWTVAPIGEKTPASPDGKRTGFIIISEDGQTFGWMNPTSQLPGGRGHNLAAFGRILDPGETSDVLWWIDPEPPLEPVAFQPWLIRASRPNSPFIARILWQPSLSKPSKAIEIELDPWEEKVYDKWRGSGDTAIKFLHNFERRIAGGRRKGSVKGELWSRHRILEWYDTVAAEYASDGKPVTLKDLGAAMGSLSDETAGERVRDAKLSWPPTPEQLLELEDDE